MAIMRGVSIDIRPGLSEEEDGTQRRRRVEVTMRRGENPRIFDADTKVEISDRLIEVRIRPQGDTSQVLLCTADLDAEMANTVIADLVYLRGDWEAR